MKRLDAKIAVVTGAGAGWGRQLAVTFAREGAYVVCVDADQTANEETVEVIAEAGGAAEAVCADVTYDEELATVFGRIADEHDRLDVLANTLCSTGGADVVGTSEDEWDLAMAINVTGPFLAMKHAVPLMRRAGGSIINISAVAPVRYDGPDAGLAASKAALNHLTRVTAAEYASQQIRVNAVIPDRCAPASDVANAALFFAGDTSRFVTGVGLIVDGGATLAVGGE
ncbi:SDR family oxidoreductase [Kribbella sp. NBC_00709]|uniref:SDR family NAD(P)-dependent oxidoreductase n=1 Tax=Kribbella sp. NBC_00709 TaxID=2975972 RepID=UPI002E2C53C2|nr:SDR family oxidoreductase [Kribbella sp. NBC_00709]